jgi:hypothetical protein
MSLELYWDDEAQTVLLCELREGWTWTELFALLDQIERLAAQRPPSARRLPLILDLSESLHLPGGNLFTHEMLQNFQRLLARGQDQAHQRGKLVLVVPPAQQGALQAVFNAIRMVHPQALNDLHLAATLDEARAHLAHNNP